MPSVSHGESNEVIRMRLPVLSDDWLMFGV